MLRSLFLKNWCQVSVKKTACAVTLSSLLLASGSALGTEGVIVLGDPNANTTVISVDGTEYTQYNLVSKTVGRDDNTGALTVDGTNYNIDVTGDVCAIENTPNSGHTIPDNCLINVGEGNTLKIMQTNSDNSAVRLSASVSNPFGLKIDGNLNITTTGGKIYSSDGIVYVCLQSSGDLPGAGQVYLDVTGDMTVNVSDVAVNQSYGVGIAEGDFSVGGDFKLSMNNVTTRSTYNPYSLYGLMLGDEANFGLVAEDVATKYEFGGILEVSGIHLSYGNSADPNNTMIVRGVSLVDPRMYTAALAEGVAPLHNMTVEGDLIVKDVTVTAKGSDAVAYGFYVEGKSASATVKGNTTITGIKATTESGNTAYVAAIEAGDLAKVHLLGGVKIGVYEPQPEDSQANSQNDASVDSDISKKGLNASGGKENHVYAIATWEGASVYINAIEKEGVLQEASKGNIVVVEGDIQNDNAGSKVAMFLCNDESKFTGYTNTADAADAGSTNIHLSNGGAWYVPGDNHLYGELNMGEKGQVYYASRSLDGTQKTAGNSSLTTLTVDKLTGKGGVFHMSVDTEKAQADRLVIGNGSGEHYLSIENKAKNAGKGDILVVTQQSGNASFRQANEVTVGNYTYTLRTDAQADGSSLTYLTPTEQLAPVTLASLSMASLGAECSAYLSNVSNLRSRLGEVRGRTARKGLWGQLNFWKDRADSFGGTSLSQDVMAVSAGYDVMPNKKWIVGAGISAVTHDQTGRECVGRVSGDANSFSFTPYGTWMHNNGTYVDIVGSVGVYDQDFDLYRPGQAGVSGSYTDFGAGVSVEVGRKFTSRRAMRTVDAKGASVSAVRQPASRGWFVEPQAQLSFYAVFADDYTTSEGSSAKRDDATFLTGRIGVVAGKDFTYKGSKKGQVYAKAGFIHEFCGDQEVVFNGERFSEDSILGSRFYYGIGADMELRGNLRAYGEIGREEGAHYTREYDVRCGIKFSY